MRISDVLKVALGLCLVVGLGGLKAADKPGPAEALKMLEDGNARYVAGEMKSPNQSAERKKLSSHSNQGNYAYATVLSCSDSRVPVELIFDVGVMDLFVVRVAGNVCNTDEIGSIEYGLAHVNTPVLVVLGHKQCGAVTAVTQEVEGDGHPLERNIPPLVASIIPAVERAQKMHTEVKGLKIVPYAIEENVWQSIENLFMQSPATREIVKKGKAKIIGAVYNLETGKVEWLPEEKVVEILAKVEKNPQRAMNAMYEMKEASGAKVH